MLHTFLASANSNSPQFYLHIPLICIIRYQPSTTPMPSVIEAVSSNIDKALIIHPSANIMVCGDFNGHNTEWLYHSHVTNLAGLFCQLFAMAQDLAQIRDFHIRIPYRDDQLCFTYFFVLILSLALLLLIHLWKNLTIWWSVLMRTL